MNYYSLLEGIARVILIKSWFPSVHIFLWSRAACFFKINFLNTTIEINRLSFENLKKFQFSQNPFIKGLTPPVWLLMNYYSLLEGIARVILIKSWYPSVHIFLWSRAACFFKINFLNTTIEINRLSFENLKKFQFSQNPFIKGLTPPVWFLMNYYSLLEGIARVILIKSWYPSVHIFLWSRAACFFKINFLNTTIEINRLSFENLKKNFNSPKIHL